jgi:hypothetical protein
MESSVSPKDEIWFLRVCHHISNTVYDKKKPVKEVLKEKLHGGYGQILRGMRLSTRYRRVGFERKREKN